MHTREVDVNQFIKEYMRSRVVSFTSVQATLKRALQFESVFEKQFIYFTEKEILQMLSSLKSRSAISLQNYVVILKHATRWFVATGLSNNTTNNYELITREKLNQCVDIDTKSSMLLSIDALQDLTNQCLNSVDKAILWLLFYGVAGEKLKELTFLTSEQLSTNNVLTLTYGDTIQLSDDVAQIVRDAFNETSIMSYGSELKINEVQGEGQIYKIRNNAIYTTHDISSPADLERRFRWVLRRITILREYFEMDLTMKSLQTSGLWYFAHKTMEEMNISSLRDFLYLEEGKKLATQYGFKSNLYVQVLIEKYKEFL